MKVALFERPGHLNVTNLPLRPLQPGEALVRVRSCGICGTDVHIVEGTSRSSPPVVLGHEYAGVIEDVPQGENSVKAGQAVAVDPNISCGTCFYCRRGLVHLCEKLRALGVDIDGGMAEFSIVPIRQLYRIPETLSPEAGAFIEPVSCAVHGIDKAGIRAGDAVVIVGGGTIGLIMLQLARLCGAATVIVAEPLEGKRRIALELGVDDAIDPAGRDLKAAVLDRCGAGADVVIECAGRPETVRTAVSLARRGGTVELFGVCPKDSTVQIEPHEIYFRELTIVGSYINPNTFSRAAALLESGKVRIDRFQIDRYPIEGVLAALDRQREGRTIKCIIQPNA